VSPSIPRRHQHHAVLGNKRNATGCRGGMEYFICMKIVRVAVHTLSVNIEYFPEKLPGLATSCLREVARGTM
jgi:hypothetical protein